MPRVLRSHVEVYVFRRARGRIEYLALRRAADRRVLPGVWQPVTGKRRPGEAALAAAAREVGEETGLAPVRWWALESVVLYYDPTHDALRVLPVFVAEIVRNARVSLSREHDAHRFVPQRVAARLFLWEAQRRALEAVTREVLGRRDLARALEVPSPGRSPRRRRNARVGPAAR